MMVCNINNKDLHAIIPDLGEIVAFYKKSKKKKPTQNNSVHAVGPYNRAGQKKQKLFCTQTFLSSD